MRQQFRHFPAMPLASIQINHQTLAILRGGDGSRPNGALLINQAVQCHYHTINTEALFSKYLKAKTTNIFENKLTLIELGLSTEQPIPVTNCAFTLIPLGSYKDRGASWVNLQNIVRIDEINSDKSLITLACPTATTSTELRLIVRKPQTWLYEQVKVAYILYRNTLARYNQMAAACYGVTVPVMEVHPAVDKILSHIAPALISPLDQPLVTEDMLHTARATTMFHVYASQIHELFDKKKIDAELATIVFDLLPKLQSDVQGWVRHPDTTYAKFAKEFITPTTQQRAQLQAFIKHF